MSLEIDMLFAIASWIAFFAAAAYAAIYPERITAARRAVWTDHPISKGDMRLVLALGGMSIAICMWASFASGNTMLAVAFVPAIVGICTLAELMRRGAFRRLQGKHLAIRLAAVPHLCMAAHVWKNDHNFALLLGFTALTLVAFPRAWSRLAIGTLTEKQEIAQTRATGIFGVAGALSVIAILVWFVIWRGR